MKAEPNRLIPQGQKKAF